MINKTMAHYTILEKIGSGGMGEVYRAEDTKLGRQVAIKVLPEEFVGDKERMARFEREARTLASLNHPNIAAIYGLEEAEGKSFLVMELVEGDTLAQKLEKGPLSIEDSLDVCLQIAEAIEAAHEKDIIHRDLKPANVKVTPEGRIKVLDFGLAKALLEEETGSDLIDSPTLTAQMTQPGMILGTAPYMSAEQARGKTVDKRTDIWAFGCILYECLTGKMAFKGDNVSEVLASILKDEPDWKVISRSIPSQIQELLRRCLAKDPRNRLQHIGDARIVLQEKPLEILQYGDSIKKKVPTWKLPLTWILLTPFILATAIFIWISLTKKESPSFSIRFSITLPPDQDFPEQHHSLAPPLALSPDGQILIYTAVKNYHLHLYRRDLDSFETIQIPGTEGATSPFFSPDGQWIGFHAKGMLQKISINGGTPLRICKASVGTGHGAAWGLPNTVIFSTHLGSGLWRVDGSGGEPERITIPNFKEGEYSHFWPQILPGNSHVMFEVAGKGMSVLSLDTRSWAPPILETTGAVYAPTGHILYGIPFTDPVGLAARSYDLKQKILTGQEVSVLDQVHREWRSTRMQVALSETGTLAYVQRREREQQLVLVNRDGRETELGLFPNWSEYPRFSPDGSKISIDTERDIVIYDLERESSSYLTNFKVSNRFDANHSCNWSLDGTHVVFTSNREGSWSIFQKTSDGTGEAESFYVQDRSHIPLGWSSDGTLLLYMEFNPDSGRDICLLPKDGEAESLLNTDFTEEMACISPDGHWLAYVSNESGQQEVYIQAFPQMGNKKKISIDGGREPVWKKDGGELFYRTEDRFMSVSVMDSSDFQYSTPQEVLRGNYVHGYYTNWDVSPDGETFVFFKRINQEPVQINIILNWFEVLKSKYPNKK